MYCEDKVNYFKLRNEGLYDVLELKTVIILIILFCCRMTSLLSIEFPQNRMPHSIVA